jgi:hypothetical protein
MKKVGEILGIPIFTDDTLPVESFIIESPKRRADIMNDLAITATALSDADLQEVVFYAEYLKARKKGV